MSVKIAINVSWSVVTEANEKVGLTGVICTELGTGAVTVRFVLPLIPFRVALIEVVPSATVVAKPPEAIVAMLFRDESQATALVMI